MTTWPEQLEERRKTDPHTCKRHTTDEEVDQFCDAYYDGVCDFLDGGDLEARLNSASLQGDKELYSYAWQRGWDDVKAGRQRRLAPPPQPLVC